MSTGFAQDKVALDNRLGGLATALRQLFNEDIPNLQIFLASKQVTDLQTLGYSSAEATLIKQNWTVIDLFRQAFQGTIPISAPTDLRTYLVPFVGVN